MVISNLVFGGDAGPMIGVSAIGLYWGIRSERESKGRGFARAGIVI